MSTPSSAQHEIDSGLRFAFGRNWGHFLRHLDDNRIHEAEASLRDMLGCQDLRGKRFLDIGSGSGLFSLAARRLGAQVLSFDFDPQSVACTAELKRRCGANDDVWWVEHGSVLDAAYVQSLGLHDIVYSWGVLHHTGHLDQALDHAIGRVAPNGQAFIALYNAQPLVSRYWTFVKRCYNRWPLSRPVWIALHWLYPTLPAILLRALQGRAYPRGMSVWHDLLDWLGGYPFEVRSPEQVLDTFRLHGFELTRLKTVGGKSGCNEFVFQRR